MNLFEECTRVFQAERELVLVNELPSTNRLAMELGAEGAPSGTLVVAEHQTAGRGRLGRSWFSPSGANLYFSLLLRPSLPPQDSGLLCLAAAVGLVEVLNRTPWRMDGPSPDPRLFIKWPNDLVSAEGRKLCGILSEMELTSDGSQIGFVVIGVGLNVNQEFFPPDLPLAESLARWRGRSFRRAALLEEIVPSIETWTGRVATRRHEMLAAWKASAHTLGRRVRVGDVEGVAVDLRVDGALILDDGEGHRQAVLAGDVEEAS